MSADTLRILDDALQDRLKRVLQEPVTDFETLKRHSWNIEDRSLNIHVKDDMLAFRRYPIAQSTDCIRGKVIDFINTFVSLKFVTEI